MKILKNMKTLKNLKTLKTLKIQKDLKIDSSRKVEKRMTVWWWWSTIKVGSNVQRVVKVKVSGARSTGKHRMGSDIPQKSSELGLATIKTAGKDDKMQGVGSVRRK